jgi:hypothetical protein
VPGGSPISAVSVPSGGIEITISASMVEAEPTIALIHAYDAGVTETILATGGTSQARSGSTVRDAIVVFGVRSRSVGSDGCNAFVSWDCGTVFMTLILPSSWRLVAVPTIITTAEIILYFWSSNGVIKVT